MLANYMKFIKEFSGFLIGGMMTAGVVDLFCTLWQHFKGAVVRNMLAIQGPDGLSNTVHKMVVVSEALASGDNITIAKTAPKMVEMQLDSSTWWSMGGFSFNKPEVREVEMQSLSDSEYEYSLQEEIPIVEKLQNYKKLCKCLDLESRQCLPFECKERRLRMLRSRILRLEEEIRTFPNDALKVVKVVSMQGNVDSIVESLAQYGTILFTENADLLLESVIDIARQRKEWQTVRFLNMVLLQRLRNRSERLREHFAANKQVSMQMDVPDSYPIYLGYANEVKSHMEILLKHLSNFDEIEIERRGNLIHSFVSRMIHALIERKKMIVVDMQVDVPESELSFYKYVKQAFRGVIEYRKVEGTEWMRKEGMLLVPNNFKRLYKHNQKFPQFQHQSIRLPNGYSIDFWDNKQDFNLQLVKSMILSDKNIIISRVVHIWTMSRKSAQYLGTSRLRDKDKQISTSLIHLIQMAIVNYLNSFKENKNKLSSLSSCESINLAQEQGGSIQIPLTVPQGSPMDPRIIGEDSEYIPCQKGIDKALCVSPNGPYSYQFHIEIMKLGANNKEGVHSRVFIQKVNTRPKTWDPIGIELLVEGGWRLADGSATRVVNALVGPLVDFISGPLTSNLASWLDIKE